MTDDERDKAVLEAATWMIAYNLSYPPAHKRIRLILDARARLAERCERQARWMEHAVNLYPDLEPLTDAAGSDDE